MQTGHLYHVRMMLSGHDDLMRSSRHATRRIDAARNPCALPPNTRIGIEWHEWRALNDWHLDALVFEGLQPSVYVASLRIGERNVLPHPCRLYPAPMPIVCLHLPSYAIALEHEPVRLELVHDGTSPDPVHLRAALIVREQPSERDGITSFLAYGRELTACEQCGSLGHDKAACELVQCTLCNSLHLPEKCEEPR